MIEISYFMIIKFHTYINPLSKFLSNFNIFFKIDKKIFTSTFQYYFGGYDLIMLSPKNMKIYQSKNYNIIITTF